MSDKELEFGQNWQNADPPSSCTMMVIKVECLTTKTLRRIVLEETFTYTALYASPAFPAAAPLLSP